MASEIIEYYADFDEKARLGGPHSIEFLRSRDIILRNLDKERPGILDVGGAAGRYSFWLADSGYDVSLIDIVPKHVEQARRTNESARRKLRSIEEGTAHALPHGDGTFDAVLLMGPLYHLPDRCDRVAAIRESLRVLRKDGVLIMAFISRFASLLDGFKLDLVRDPAFRDILDADVKTGLHRNDKKLPHYFTTAYLHHPDEIRGEIEEAGGAPEKVYAVEGFANCVPDLETKLKDDGYRSYLLAKLRETEEDVSLIGASSHLMATARK